MSEEIKDIEVNEENSTEDKNTQVDNVVKTSNESLPEFKLDSLNLSKSNIINILEDLRVIKKRFNHIENIIKEAERAQYSPSRDLPGVEGIFNGEYMVSADGVKHEVPKNYAAKSLLVNGDTLKMMENEGKVAFKVVNKVPRKKIEGLLSKKDGKYVILSDNGSYNLLKTAVEFRNIKQGEWVLAHIPESGNTNNFAAIDKIIKKESKKEVKFFEKPKKEVSVNSNNTSSANVNTKNKDFTKSGSLDQRPKLEVKSPASNPQNISKSTQQPSNQSGNNNQSNLPKIQFSDDDLI